MTELENLEPFMSKWVVIYPLYLNKARSLKNGRKIGKDQAVDRPSADEIGRACADLGLRHHVEKQKRHPGDFLNVGRVRVELYADAASKKPINELVTCRSTLYRMVSEKIVNGRKNPKKKPTPSPSNTSSNVVDVIEAPKKDNSTSNPAVTYGGRKKRR